MNKTISLPPKSYCLQYLYIGKYAVLFLILFLVTQPLFAFSQRVNLTEYNSNLKDVLEKIKKQSGYGILYTSSMVTNAKKVTVTLKNASLSEAMDMVLSNQPLSYTIEKNTVILKRKQLHAQIQKTESIQNILVQGKVTNTKNVPLPGVSVRAKNARLSTITDEKGDFKLELKAADVLVFSSIGFETQEISVGQNTSLTIALAESSQELEAVTVVAYGTVKKGENTSSTAQVEYEEFKNRNLTNIASVIEGSAPGIQSTSASGQPGEAPAIRIRGFGSINADQNPIYVVDGAIYDGGLSNFNMDDVASVSVLKDASATALYGSRGANGVIIITTKKGRSNVNTLSVKANQAYISRALPEYDRVDAFEYYPLMWEAYKNLLITSGQNDLTARQNATNSIKDQLGYNPFNVPDNQIVDEDGILNSNAKLLWGDDLDWFKAVQQLGKRREYSLSYTGGNQKSNYYASLGYINENGFIKNSNMERYMGRLNITSNPISWFKTSLNLASTFTNTRRAGTAGGTNINNPFYFARLMGPIYPVYLHDPTTGDYILDSNGQKTYDYGDAIAPSTMLRPGAAMGSRHIVAENDLDRETWERTYSSARSYAEISFTKDLKFTTNISLDLTNQHNADYGNNIIGVSAPAGSATKSDSRWLSYTFNQLLTYNKQFGDHKISLLAGHENFSRHIRGFSASRTKQVVADNYELTNFAVITGASSQVDRYRIESYLSRANYDYKSKYFLSTSLRYDGNSRFFRDYRWEPFYSFGLAWRIDHENFMKNVSFVDELKVRTSYGRVGNDVGIGYYPYQALYALGFNNALEPGIRQSNVPNLQITWEGQKSTDVAVEFGLFKRRITGTVEYYNRTSDDLIFNVDLPLSMGGYSVPQNIGSLENKGWEMQLAGDVVRTKDFSWNIGINASTLTNRITKMPNDRPEIIESTNYRKLMVGQSIYDFWVREYRGVDPSDGRQLFTANDTQLTTNRVIDGEILTTLESNAKFVYAGSSIPDLFGSFTTRLKYKGFELSALFSYQLGGKTLDMAYSALMHNGTYGLGWHTDIARAWKQPGDITDVPKLENGLPNSISSRYLIDASFLNIRNISLGYNLPRKWLGYIKSENARIFINGENLHWFSKRKGMNVQQSYTGITSNVYVPARTISLGLNVNF